MATRYPLARLASLRAQRATGAALDLAVTLRGLTEAEAAHARAVARRDAALTAARLELVERDAGATAIWAIVRREAYAVRLRRDAARAGEAVVARAAELAGWRDLVAAAQAQVVETRAEREVVDRHHTRWQDDQRRTRERRED